MTAIKEAMEMKGLKDKDLISAIGSKTAVRLVLNRKRALPIEMIRDLRELLGLPVDALIQPSTLNGNQEVLN
jgi:HTH-type transcriptional regulator/antitoxin HigA